MKKLIRNHAWLGDRYYGVYEGITKGCHSGIGHPTVMLSEVTMVIKGHTYVYDKHEIFRFFIDEVESTPPLY
jgi:hypothetical protein